MTDIIGEVIAYLSTKTSIAVASEVPPNRPAQFIAVGRVGGSEDKYLHNPRVDIDTWGTSDLDASTIGDEVRDWMFDLPGASSLVSDVERSTYYRSDIDGAHRYTGTYEITRNV